MDANKTTDKSIPTYAIISVPYRVKEGYYDENDALKLVEDRCDLDDVVQDLVDKIAWMKSKEREIRI